MGSQITALISAFGYGGIAFLMALESACLPLPSEVIMPFSGYLVSTGRFDLWLAATAGAVGCNLGSTLAYLVGRHGGRRFIERWGRFVLLGPRDLDRADRFFARYGAAAVFVTRLMPVVRTFISLPAGIARMPFWRFQICTFLGSWPWCFALTWVGLRLGKAWAEDPALRRAMHSADVAVVAIVAIGAACYLLRRRRRR